MASRSRRRWRLRPTSPCVSGQWAAGKEAPKTKQNKTKGFINRGKVPKQFLEGGRDTTGGVETLSYVAASPPPRSRVKNFKQRSCGASEPNIHQQPPRETLKTPHHKAAPDQSDGAPAPRHHQGQPAKSNPAEAGATGGKEGSSGPLPALAFARLPPLLRSPLTSSTAKHAAPAARKMAARDSGITAVSGSIWTMPGH